MAVSTNDGGTREYVGRGQVFRHFQAVSNEIYSPRVLVCPLDTRRSAENFGAGLGNANLSFFLGPDVDENRPDDIFSGDRNVTNGTRLVNGLMVVGPNSRVGWTQELHKGRGNVLLSDGSVSLWPTPWPRLDATNRLEFP